MISAVISYFEQKAQRRDIVILFAFTLLILWNPYYRHGTINIFEMGLYLPGIEIILKGGVPFRDVFHLRGPLELYIPAAMMAIGGVHISVLAFYFYLGTVLTFFICILIAKELFQTRYVLYAFVPVLIARTFPRVVYTYWGGMRYALGLLAVFFLVKFFKTKKTLWMFLGGLASVCGLLTSVEIGVCSLGGFLAALTAAGIFNVITRQDCFKSGGVYLGGCLAVGLPYAIYLYAVGALGAYVSAVSTVVTQMEVVINQHLVSTFPSRLAEALAAMITPTAKNFRHLTPAYLYILGTGYLLFRFYKRRVTTEDICLLGVGMYGFIMYNSAFRSIWAAQFEMALQLEKILYFFCLERFYCCLWQRRNALKMFLSSSKFSLPKLRLKIWGLNALLLGFLFFSIGYSMDRYNKRFFVFKYFKNLRQGGDVKALIPFLGDHGSRPLTIERARGVIVSNAQADELERLADYFTRHIPVTQPVLMYPELAAYSFLLDRPFPGRFPMATFSWFDERWHEEFVSQIKRDPPVYVVLQSQFPPEWEKIYLSRPENKRKYQEVMDFLTAEYALEETMPLSNIYKRKE